MVFIYKIYETESAKIRKTILIFINEFIHLSRNIKMSHRGSRERNYGWEIKLERIDLSVVRFIKKFSQNSGNPKS